MRWVVVGALLLLGAPGGAETVYEQQVITDWNRSQIDVHIVPPGHGPLANQDESLAGGSTAQAHPWDNAYVRAMEDAVEGWRRAIDAFGEPWLRDAVVLTTTVGGRDGAVGQGADILIVPAESHLGSLGMAFTSNRPCAISVAMHRDESLSYEDMFNIAGHEVGHCLGLAHVDGVEPSADIMATIYPEAVGAAGNPIHCMSNLNVRGIEGAFAEYLGQPEHTWRATAYVAASEYQRAPCA